MPEASAYLLKVFSGPHVGAEIPLADGEYVIGSDDGCDIIFSDRFVAPQHAKLTINGTALQCVPLENAGIFVGGERVTETGRSLTPFEYFTLGNTHLALGPSDAPWPVIEFPEYQLNTSPPPAPPPAPTAEEQSPTAEPAAEPTPETAAAPAEPTPAPESQPRSRWRALVAVAVVLLFVSLVWGATSVRWGGEPGPVAPALSLEERIQAAIKPYVRKGARFSVRSVDGRLHVEGYVEKPAERHELTSAIQQVSPSIRCRVYDSQSLVAAVNQVLRGTDTTYLAKAGKPGEVIVTGKGTDRARWQAVQHRIHEDVRMIAKLIDQVKIEKPTTPVAVASTEPVRPVEAPVAPPTESIKPEETPTESESPSETEVAVAPPMVTPVATTPPEEKPTPLALDYVSVSIGANASIMLPGGQRLFVGAPVGDGYRITSITPQAVVLVRQDERLVLPLGGTK